MSWWLLRCSEFKSLSAQSVPGVCLRWVMRSWFCLQRGTALPGLPWLTLVFSPLCSRDLGWLALWLQLLRLLYVLLYVPTAASGRYPWAPHRAAMMSFKIHLVLGQLTLSQFPQWTVSSTHWVLTLRDGQHHRLLSPPPPTFSVSTLLPLVEGPSFLWAQPLLSPDTLAGLNTLIPHRLWHPILGPSTSPSLGSDIRTRGPGERASTCPPGEGRCHEVLRLRLGVLHCPHSQALLPSLLPGHYCVGTLSVPCWCFPFASRGVHSLNQLNI